MDCRLLCPSPSGVCSNSLPMSRWWYLAISLSAAAFSFCFQSFPTSGGFSFSISPSNEYSGLSSFRIDWFDSLAVQGTLSRLLQHHNFKAPILWCWDFFKVQLSQLYMATGKTIPLTIQTFVGKVMSLFFQMLSRFVAQLVKNLPAMWVTWVWSLGWEKPLEEGFPGGSVGKEWVPSMGSGKAPPITTTLPLPWRSTWQRGFRRQEILHCGFPGWDFVFHKGLSLWYFSKSIQA